MQCVAVRGVPARSTKTFWTPKTNTFHLSKAKDIYENLLDRPTLLDPKAGAGTRGVVVGMDDGQTNGINFIQFVCPSRTPMPGGRMVWL